MSMPKPKGWVVDTWALGHLEKKIWGWGRIACSTGFLFVISLGQALTPPSVIPGTHSSGLARNCISVGTGCRPFLRTAARKKEHNVFSVT